MSNPHPPNAGKGRVKGVPNKATSAAREAIGAFVDGNVHRLQEWLDMIARGVEKPKSEDAAPDSLPEYAVKPDPQKAFELFNSVVEYHIPKLARTEHVMDPESATTLALVNISFVDKPK